MPGFFALAIPGLEWLGKAFAYALEWLSTLTGGNLGFAIILLTVAMRVVLLPLTIKQTKSMIAMQRLQPQLKEIQKKYKDDREKMGQEMMKLYKENKVSPLGGCLPLILQLPIIFAVFDVLHNLSNKKSQYYKILLSGGHTSPMFLGINITKKGSDLWKQGAYAQIIILILFTIVTGYISAKMMTTDPKQSKMMAMMPVLMGFFAWILPAGVTLYIIVTNVLTGVQQYVQLEREGFYDERRQQRQKAGETLSRVGQLKERFIDIGSRALVALRIKEKLETPQKKKAVEGKKKADKNKTPEGPKQEKATGETARKKPAGKPQGEKKARQEPAEPKVGKQAGATKSYPAKKKSPGKK